MKIYTKTGDAGETSLYGGGRVRKDHARIDAYGTLDELNATLGVARAELAREESAHTAGTTAPLAGVDRLLAAVQHHLFDLGAELANPKADLSADNLIETIHVEQLEGAIDQYEASLAPLKQFILPGGTPLAAQLHVCRCVCRRAERLVVGIDEPAPPRDTVLVYLNRLSDLLFVLARMANSLAGKEDIFWEKSARSPSE